MEVKFKFDAQDVARELQEQVSAQVEKMFELRVTELVAAIKAELDVQARAIADALEIKDNRKRERVKRALTSNLDKWTRSVLK